MNQKLVCGRKSKAYSIHGQLKRAREYHAKEVRWSLKRKKVMAIIGFTSRRI